MKFEEFIIDIKNIATLGSIIIMGCGLYLIHSRLKEKGQGYGVNSLKALGIIIFIPSLIILASQNIINDQALTALLGTVAGYVLSTTQNDQK